MATKPSYEALEERVRELEAYAEERHQMEERLRWKRGLIDAIIGSCPGVFYVSDKDGRFLRWSKNFETLSGFSAEEISQMSPLDFFRETDKPRIIESVNNANAAGRSFLEVDFIFKDSDATPYYLSLIPVNIDSKPYLIGMGVDISQRKQAENALAESERQYREFFESNYAVMLIVDPRSADIVEANAAACFYYGYSKEIITRMKITDINMLPSESVFDEMEAAKAEQRNYFNFQHRLADGRIRDVEVYCGPIWVRDEELLFSIIHDITARKIAEAEREKLIVELQDALAEVKTLRGFIPICASCKKIRDDAGYWQQIENYIQDRSEAQFSHGLCPDCKAAMLAEFEREKDH